MTDKIYERLTCDGGGGVGVKMVGKFKIDGKVLTSQSILTITIT